MPYHFDDITVLIAEDIQPMAQMTRSILETFGFRKILVTRNGEEAFETFCKTNADIILTDWMMKPRDGIELTLSIRNQSKSPNPFVPVIIMTGFSEKERVMEARDAGVTEFLVKPFQAKDLYKRLVQVIERPRQFVKIQSFFGPDRRRHSDPNYAGPWRRATDHELQKDGDA